MNKIIKKEKINLFKKLGNALIRLEESLLASNDELFKVEGVVQRFEFTIELFWLVLKKILREEQIETISPREVMQQAYRNNLIDDEDVWIAMLKDRNATSHIYDELDAHEILNHVDQNYFHVMKKTYAKLKDELIKRNITF